MHQPKQDDPEDEGKEQFFELHGLYLTAFLFQGGTLTTAMDATPLPGYAQIAVAFFSMVPPTIFALGALIHSIQNGKKADTLQVKADQIHENTNGNLAEIKEQLRTALGRIETLEGIIKSFPWANPQA